jgi:hypothetical protein
VPFKALLHGRIRQGIREEKRMAILTKVLFLWKYPNTFGAMNIESNNSNLTNST